jgi:ATP-dependent helicase/DNAse subunit B
LIQTEQYVYEYYKTIDNGNTVIIDSNELEIQSKEWLERLIDKPISVTDLEKYANCPYQYFLNKIIGIKEIKEPEPTFEGTEKGMLYHEVLYRFFTALSDEQLKSGKSKPISNIQGDSLPILAPVRLYPENRAAYLEKLLNIARDEIEQIKYDNSFFEVEESQIIGTEDEPGIFQKWLDSELDRVCSGWGHLPVSFELSFGIGSRKGKKIPVEAIELDPNLKIMGKIDRIEVMEDEPDNFIIADYKSRLNYLPGKSDIEKGLAFQMPLYIAASKIILKDIYNIEAEPYGAVYYAINPDYDIEENVFKSEKFIMLSPSSPLAGRVIDTKTNKPKKISGTLNTHDEIEYIIETSINHAKNILDNISKGIFAINPAKKSSCKYCSYESICRYKE